MDYYKSYTSAFAAFALLVSLFIGVWFPKSISNNIEQVISALQYLEASYRPLPQRHPGPRVLVGFGGCADVTVDALQFFRALGVDPNIIQSEATPNPFLDDDDEEVHLETLDDIVREFTRMFAAGAAAERYVANERLFARLISRVTQLKNPLSLFVKFPPSTPHQLVSGRWGPGGNALVMAERLAREGAQVALAARLSPQLRSMLPHEVKVLSAPADFGLPTIPLSDVHLVLEYEKGSVWRNITSPRANRYILIRDEENPRLSGLWSGILFEWRRTFGGTDPDLFVLGGLQTMDNSRLNPDMRLHRLHQLQEFLSIQLPSSTLVHFEMASFTEKQFAMNVIRTILPYVDSIGLNEQELPNLVRLLSEGKIAPHASASTPRTAVMLDGLREIWAMLTAAPTSGLTPGQRRLSRLHLHTLGYQIVMVRRPVDPLEARILEQRNPALLFTDIGRAWPFARAAAAKASLIAHRHTCESASVNPVRSRLLMDDSFAITTNADRWFSGVGAPHQAPVSLLPRFHFNSTAPVTCWHESEPSLQNSSSSAPVQAGGTATRIEICIAPVLVCTRVTRTVGAGDNISAGALRAQIVARSHA